MEVSNGVKKKILITGATGFIGRNIAEYFAGRGDFEVYGTYHKNAPLKGKRINMSRADLTSRNDVARAVRGMDIVIQAAATTSGAKEIIANPCYHVTDNALMNSLVFRSAYEQNVSHVIFFSCVIMYKSGRKPLKETSLDLNKEIHPSYFGAAWTKVYNEKMCEFYSRIGKAKYTVIRHSNIYGPYDKFDLERSHVFGATVAKVMSAKNARITVWGNGKEEKDLLYISDLIDFVRLAVEAQRPKFVLCNVGYGRSITVKELVKKIISCSGRDIRPEYDISKPSISAKFHIDISKAGDLFGWQPKVPLEEGIRRTIDWYRLNRPC